MAAPRVVGPPPTPEELAARANGGVQVNGRTAATTGGVAAAPQFKYSPWAGYRDAVTRTQLRPTARTAFNPMGDNRISDAFDPFSNTRYKNVYQDAGELARDSGNARADTEGRLATGFAAPQYSAPAAIRPGSATATTTGSAAGMNAAASALSQADAARRGQSRVYGTALDWAQGNMPSVGQNIANEAGAVANEQFQRAGSEANQAYNLNDIAARSAFSNAAAQQAEQTRQAGVNAGRATKDAAAQAILQQASLAAGARGGNIGMALRNAQQGAAFQTQGANVAAARQVADANSAASYAASAAQRQADAQRAAAGITTQGTQERAASAAAAAELQARFRGAQIGSAEQQAALGLAADQTNAIRAADLSAAGAATNLGGLGLGQDQLVTGVNVGNVDRAFAGDQFNQGMGFNYDQLNSQGQLATNALNANVWNDQAGRYQGDQHFGIGQQGNMAAQAATQAAALGGAQIQSEQALAQLQAQLAEQARQRRLQEYGIRTGAANAANANDTAMFGNWMQLGGGLAAAGATVGAGYLMGRDSNQVAGPTNTGAPQVQSDRRGKKNIRTAKTPDFRKATASTYEYKNPKAPGAAPGKHTGPMAQQLPKSVLRKGDDGLLRVDIGRLALELTSAVGDLQRRIDAA